MIKPLNENVVVEVLEEKEEGGLLVPDTHKKSKFGAGRVLAIEKGLPIKEGDLVYFDTFLLTYVKIEDRELSFIKFTDILGYESLRGRKAKSSEVNSEEVREAEELPSVEPESPKTDIQEGDTPTV